MTRRSVLIGVAALLILGIVGAYRVGWQLVRPVPTRVGNPPAELQAESVAFRSDSGSTIRGWLSRGEAKRGAVLLLPGVRADRRAMLDRALLLRSAGYSTLSIDFQATGESPGDVITLGWRERLDVIAAVQSLRSARPGEPIGIVGTSLGGAATVLAAPSLDVQAVVLEAVYPSLDVALENRLRMRLGALGPPLAPLLLVQLRPRWGVWPSELRPVDRIALLRCPVFIIGGAVDLHTTLEDTERLYAAAAQPKELWVVPGAAHVDYLHAAGKDYERRVLEFFERALRGTRVSTGTT